MSTFNFLDKNQKHFAVLIDPDKPAVNPLSDFLKTAENAGAACILIGGSLLSTFSFETLVKEVKRNTSLPVLLFPGNNMQISSEADGILFLSLLSGRNPEYLIGQHIHAAPILKNTGLEIIPTAYLLIESGKTTTAAYISNTTPIPSDKPEIAAATALAGQYLGMKAIYLDAGSGAINRVNTDIINRVAKETNLPLVVGGGIRSSGDLLEAFSAGANLVVIGNHLESNPELLSEISAVKRI